MQNTQPTAQPTCVETQTPSPGRSTLSIVRPSSSRQQEAQRAVDAAMLGDDADERSEALREQRQRAAQCQRQLRVLGLSKGVERKPADPSAQDQRLVPRPRARSAQRRAQVVD